MKASFSFTGGAELAANLRALPKSVSRNVQIDALMDAAEPMVAVARRSAPRSAESGPHLADNIEAAPVRGGKDEFGDTKATAVAWGPIRGFFRAWFNEYGTVHMSAQPFMRPAFDSQAERSLGILIRRTWENIQSWVLSRNVQ